MNDQQVVLDTSFSICELSRVRERLFECLNGSVQSDSDASVVLLSYNNAISVERTSGWNRKKRTVTDVYGSFVQRRGLGMPCKGIVRVTAMDVAQEVFDGTTRRCALTLLSSSQHDNHGSKRLPSRVPLLQARVFL